jgi:DNA-directed RNA polymerase subunit RPC12/RpoP
MFIIECPHCNEPVIIQEVNCSIFRHGIFKTNYEQIPPHSPKEQCDEWVEKNMIYGCGKPFQIINNKAVRCDYI